MLQVETRRVETRRKQTALHAESSVESLLVHPGSLAEQKLTRVCFGTLEFLWQCQGLGSPGFLVICHNGLVDIGTQVQHGILMERCHKLEAKQGSNGKMNLHGCNLNVYDCWYDVEKWRQN
jgi:hypothetical protein